MRCAAVFVVCLCLGAVGVAEDVVLRNVPSEPGVYYLVLERQVDGSLSVSRIPVNNVVSLDASPVDPPLDKFTELKKAVLTATAAVVDSDPGPEKKALATLYTSLAGLPFQNRSSLQKSTDLMFGALGLSSTWQIWKTSVDQALSAFQELEVAKTAWAVVGSVL